MVRMSTTEVARNFSAVINRVGAGEEIEIVRNGAPVAELRRPSRPRGITGTELGELLASLPPVDEDFARDVQEARRKLGSPESAWPSS
jgi:antitoxin (DNA-binding transcriptional repressor) of toxin-antitoxin stability system